MPMRATRGGSLFLRVSHRGSCLGCHSTQNLYMFLFLVPIACLNFEQTIAGISMSIHFRTVVANSNNFQTQPVYYLLSTNEINPSENIFNNNVMQKGISKIVKPGRRNQFLLERRMLQPNYITQVVEYTSFSPVLPGTEELLLSNLNVPRRRLTEVGG